jgi:hypothetical protein
MLRAQAAQRNRVRRMEETDANSAAYGLARSLLQCIQDEKAAAAVACSNGVDQWIM